MSVRCVRVCVCVCVCPCVCRVLGSSDIPPSSKTQLSTALLALLKGSLHSVLEIEAASSAKSAADSTETVADAVLRCGAVCI